MPAGQEMCCGAQEVALKLLPLHDFVPLDLSQVLVESFVGFIFKIFEKLDLEDTWSAKILTRNLKKSKKNLIFLIQIILFLSESEFYMI